MDFDTKSYSMIRYDIYNLFFKLEENIIEAEEIYTYAD